jgi:outer membrane protein TolC
MVRRDCLPATVCIAISMLVLPLVGSGLAETLDLEMAIRLALQHNLELARGGIGVAKSKLGVVSAYDEFAATLEPSGSIESTDGDTEFSYGLRTEKRLLSGAEIGLGADVSQFPSMVDDPWRSAVQVDISQPLFRRFGRLVQREGITDAEDQLRTQRRQWELQKAGMIVDVVRAFETLVKLGKQLEGDAAVVDRLQRLHELTDIRERQGRGTRVDSLRAELEWGQARARLESHRASSFSTWQDLAELLGIPAEPRLDLVPPPLPDIVVPDMKSAVATALVTRLDYAQAIQDYETAERSSVLSKRDLLPDLDLVASQNQSGSGDDFADSTELGEGTWNVGLKGGLDLFNRRGRTAVKSADLDVDAAGQTVAIIARTVASEVQQAISAYRQARTDLELAGRNFEIAGARTELARTLFEMGRGDSFSASDAEIAYVDAEATLLSSRATACIAGYELLRIMGTLTDLPEDLKPPPDWEPAQ